MKTKITILAVALCCACSASFAWEWDGPDSFKLTDLGGMKVVILNGTQSKDGHYALGWTLRPGDKKTLPVDWSLWDKDGSRKFTEIYLYNENDLKHPRYKLISGVVDFRHKKILELPEAEMVNSHCYVSVSWSPEVNGRRSAFVENPGRHNELNVWLVSIDGRKMRQADIYPALRKGVVRLLRDKRPYDYGLYERWFPVNEEGREVVFHAHSADVPFKAWFDEPDVKGWISVRLREGTVGKAWSDSPRDNPYAGDTKLALANRKMNQIYTDLLRTLKPAARIGLEKEQREWNRERESNARARAWSGDTSFQTCNRPMIETTWKRAVELKARPNGYRPANLGGSKVLIFNGTKSKDGLYAIGWTSVEAYGGTVDWSEWDPDYPWSFKDEGYDIVNCVVDFQHKKTLPLPTDFPGVAQEECSNVAVSWGPVENGRRYGFAQSETHFHTVDFWLVVIDQTGMRELNLTPILTKQALQIVRDKRPRPDPADYKDAVMLGARGLDHREIAFHGQSADIPFDANIPENWDPKMEVKGWITVSLPEGKVEKAWSDTPVDNPFVDNRELAKADGELNRIYAALLEKLEPNARDGLKKEESDWIRERDMRADKEAADASLFSDGDMPSVARDKSLLEATKERAKELKERLEEIKN